MANPVKGEVAFKAGNKDYTFVFGTYAQAALQRRTGIATGKFFNRQIEDWGVDDALAVFHAGLLRHHKISEEEAADLMDELGMEKANGIIGEGLSLAFKSNGKGDDRPTKPSQA